MTSRTLALHGVSLEVELPEQALPWLQFDFAAFLQQRPSLGAQRIRWIPEARELPRGLPRRFLCRQFLVLGRSHERIVVYPGQGWAGYRPGRDLDWYCTDLEFGYLRLTMFIHCLLGLGLERSGLPRVHGLALARPEQQAASLVLLPPGGGKSTLAHALILGRSELKLLSEDTPIVDARGGLWSYPFRLGLRKPTALPHQERQGKRLIPFPGPAPLGSFGCREVLVGAWTQAGPHCEPLAPVGRFWPLFREAWLAYGVPQLLEMQLPLGVGQAAELGVRLWRRCRHCLYLARKCAWYRFWLGPDPERNADFLTSWLADRS